jgi:hypothetical protein
MEINYVLLPMRTQNVQCVLYDRPEDGFAYEPKNVVNICVILMQSINAYRL